MDIGKRTKKLRNVLLFGGLNKGEFEKIRNSIAEENFKSIHLYSFLGFAVGLFLVISECFVTGEMSRIWLDVTLCFSMLAINVLYRKSTIKSSNIITLIMMIGMMAVGIAISMHTPDKQSTTFMVLMNIVPLVFCVRPIISLIIVIFFAILFITLTILFRAPAVILTDVINCFIFGMLSCTLNIYISSLKMQARKMSYENMMISELDVLTGVNNLNSFKKNIKIKSHVSGITCVYVDVNELHEYNSFRGHDEGDRLLVYLAAVLIEHFERGDIYRISGDEFVCFCKETNREKLKRLRESVEERVRERSYSVTFGWASTEEDIAITELVDRAETAMLENKKKYYYKR